MTTLSEELRQQERAIVEEFFREKAPEALKSRARPGPESECTETSCVSFAETLLGTGDLQAADNQGANSFTLICPSRAVVVQFRLVPLDTSIISVAHEIYGDLVPRVELVDGFPLPVYTSKLIAGRCHIHQPFPNIETDFPLEREKVTVAELGRFVARAAHFQFPGQLSDLGLADSSWTASARDTFRRLLDNSSLKTLAPELVTVIASIQPELHLLGGLPAVLTHSDFAQINILVDDEGRVTGVIDFEHAQAEAFGMSIWGLYECFFGSMEGGKWMFYDMPAPHGSAPGQSVREVLEATFWNALWAYTPPSLKRREVERAVRVALCVGVIRRYFVRGMLDEIDLSSRVHQLSLEYARGILPQVWREA